jgi:hypothetical protein
MPRIRGYRNGVLTAEDFPPAEVSEHLKEDSALASRGPFAHGGVRPSSHGPPGTVDGAGSTGRRGSAGGPAWAELCLSTLPSQDRGRKR